MPYTVFLEWYLYWENNRQLMHPKLNEKKKITVAGNKWYKIERVGYSVPKSREN